MTRVPIHPPTTALKADIVAKATQSEKNSRVAAPSSL